MHDGGAMFQSSATRILSAFVHFIGVSIVAHCLSRRVAVERLSTISGLSQLSLARGLLLLILLDSWLFLITGGMVIFGVGLESSDFVCSLGIYLCIVFYSTSKALIYFFLVEKMYIVWAPLAGSQRYRSPIYIFASCILLGYLIIIALLFIGRISRIRADGSCVIGLRNIASIPLIAYDLFTNIILTGLFLYPLWRSTTLKPSIKRIATRTTLAALVALVTSTVNMLILTLMHGEQLGWVCLGACGIDVVVNALTLFWVTTGANHNDGRDRFDDPFPWSSSKAAAIVLRSRSRHLSIPRQSPGNSFVSDIGTTVPRDMVWKVDLTPDKPYLPDSAPAAMQDLSPIRGRASISGLSDTRRSGVRSYP